MDKCSQWKYKTKKALVTPYSVKVLFLCPQSWIFCCGWFQNPLSFIYARVFDIYRWSSITSTDEPRGRVWEIAENFTSDDVTRQNGWKRQQKSRRLRNRLTEWNKKFQLERKNCNHVLELSFFDWTKSAFLKWSLSKSATTFIVLVDCTILQIMRLLANEFTTEVPTPSQCKNQWEVQQGKTSAGDPHYHFHIQ